MSEMTPGVNSREVGFKVQPAVHAGTNKPVVIVFLGENAYRIGVNLAMQLGSDMCNAANMASLQAAFRAFCIEEGSFSSEQADHLLAAFATWMEAGGADTSNNNIVEFKPTSERGS